MGEGSKVGAAAGEVARATRVEAGAVAGAASEAVAGVAATGAAAGAGRTAHCHNFELMFMLSVVAAFEAQQDGAGSCFASFAMAIGKRIEIEFELKNADKSRRFWLSV